MFRRIIEPKRKEVARLLVKLYNLELCAVYFSLDIITATKPRVMRSTVRMERVGEKKNDSRILMEKPEIKRPL